MKNICILAVTLLCFLVGACSKDNEVRVMPEFDMGVAPVKLYKQVGSEATVLISTTEQEVSASCNCDWLTVDVNTKRAIFTITAANETGEARTIEVTFLAGSYSKKIIVNQMPFEKKNGLQLGQDTADGLGMVYWVSPDDASVGKAVSLKRLEGKPFEATMIFHNATSKVDGAANTLLYTEHTVEEAAGYCTSMGEGWYLPAQNELAEIFDSYNGIAHDDPSFVINNIEAISDVERMSRAKFNKWLTDLGGVVMDKSVAGAGESYWSSTEFDAQNTFGVRFGKWALDKWKKSGTARFVRCVKRVGNFIPPVEPATLSLNPTVLSIEAEKDKTAVTEATTNQDPSTLTVTLADASWVGYAVSGTTITFTSLSENMTGDIRSTSAIVVAGAGDNTATVTLTINQAKKTEIEPWKLGDIVPDVIVGGQTVKGGLVYWVDPADGTRAKIVSLERTSLVWTTATKAPVYGATDADGAVNTKKIADSETAADVPAVAWCLARGEGWYWPSRMELIEFFDFYNGCHSGEGFTNDVPANISEAEKAKRKVAEDLLKSVGGDPVNGAAETENGDSYWGSTETSDGSKVFYIRFGKYGDLNLSKTSTTARSVRAVRVVVKTN